MSEKRSVGGRRKERIERERGRGEREGERGRYKGRVWLNSHLRIGGSLTNEVTQCSNQSTTSKS